VRRHRSQNDYLEIASRFHTVLPSDVPKMSVRLASEARRFTWLVDVLYDRRVRLILSAQCPPEELYVEGPRRTSSRAPSRACTRCSRRSSWPRRREGGHGADPERLALRSLSTRTTASDRLSRTRAQPGALDERFARFAWRQRVQHGTELAVAEVAQSPSLQASRESPSSSAPTSRMAMGGSCCAPAAGEQVRLRVVARRLLAELALVDEVLDEGVVARALHQARAAEVVHARVARVHRPARQRGHDQEGRQRAVRLLLRRRSP
jgi:hypothetical protein